MKILIVEDNGLVALNLRSYIETFLGHEVVGVAASTASAMKIATAVPPDLALMDIRLAFDSCGIDAARQLYRSFGCKSLFLTANDQSGLRFAGTVGVVAKPYTIKEIRQALHAVEASLLGMPVPEVTCGQVEVWPLTEEQAVEPEPPPPPRTPRWRRILVNLGIMTPVE